MLYCTYVKQGDIYAKRFYKTAQRSCETFNYTSQVSLITVSSHDLNLLLLEYEKLEHTKQLNTEIQNQDRFGVAS